MAFALAGCGESAPSSSSSTESTATESTVTVSASTLQWTTVNSAEEAAKGAGFDEFTVPQAGSSIALGELGQWSFCYAKGLAEADGGAAAAAIVIRKGVGTGDNTQELSEYTGGWADLKGIDYAHEWDLDVDGTAVRCYGNEQGKVSKAIWSDGKNSYSILVLGMGDNW